MIDLTSNLTPISRQVIIGTPEINEDVTTLDNRQGKICITFYRASQSPVVWFVEIRIPETSQMFQCHILKDGNEWKEIEW